MALKNFTSDKGTYNFPQIKEIDTKRLRHSDFYRVETERKGNSLFSKGKVHKKGKFTYANDTKWKVWKHIQKVE